ncbi:MAG: hypothetical protein CMJ83_19210 [Planctomycetes bacterium]|nr:hypothetical protein [Planctomycetota bacterium]
MNLPRLINRSISQRWFSSCLTSLSVALGVMLVAAILVVKDEMEQSFLKPGRGYSLVVGPPKGSSLTLVLNTVFHMETSAGLLPFRVLDSLEQSRYVKLAVPYSVGDTFKGYRVIGTTGAVFSKYFPHPEGKTPQEKFADGGPFHYDRKALALTLSRLTNTDPPEGAENVKEVNEAVVGYEVARRLGVRVGYQIEPTHGVEGTTHAEETLWRVTGVLKRTGTPIDKVVLINLDSFYRIPDHKGALVIKPDGSGLEATFSAALVFPKPGVNKALLYARLKGRKDVLVAEVDTELRKLFSLVGDVDKAFLMVSVLVVVIGVLSIMVAIYNTMNERRREIAILRAIGARKTTVMSAIVGEAGILSFFGAITGLLMAHGLVAVSAGYVEQKANFRPDPTHVMVEEIMLLAGVTILGALAGLIPAWKAYRTDVATHLAPLS